jgi:hypothetical protein
LSGRHFSIHFRETIPPLAANTTSISSSLQFEPEKAGARNNVDHARLALLHNRRKSMKLRILGAAALLSALLVPPAMAQEVIYNPGYCAQFYPNANCQNKGPGNPYTDSYQRRAAYRHGGDWQQSNNGWGWDDNRRSGFWPGDVAAGIVGGAVGTAAAIATAPFAGPSYAERNGFVCTPGTWFRGEDGRRHICQ